MSPQRCDLRTGRPGVAWTIPGRSRIRYVAIDRAGLYAAGGNWAGTMWIWRIRDRKRMATFRAHPARLPIRAIAFSPNGNVLATATDGSEAQLWSVRGRRLATLEGHKGGINDLEFSPDGELLVTASDDGTVKVWGVDDASLRVELRQGRPGRALAASFDPAGRRIVVGASDGSSDIYACPVCGGEEELFRFANEQAPRVP